MSTFSDLFLFQFIHLLSRIMTCIVQKFASIVAASSESSAPAESGFGLVQTKGTCNAEELFGFLQWAQGFGTVAGLHVREKKRKFPRSDNLNIFHRCYNI